MTEKANVNGLPLAVGTKEKDYFFGLDIIRIIAMFLVVLVHATTFNSFDSVNVNSVPTFLWGMSRYIAMACVPIFMTLTGFLSINKKPTLSYYKKAVVFLTEYFLCSVAILIFNRFFYGTPIKLGSFFSVYRFTIGYSWYIGMFLGLFLLAPFLNMLYKAIPKKIVPYFMLIIVVIFSTNIVTTWWHNTYPIMYYFIGCFIRDFKPKAKKYVTVPLIFVIAAVQTVIAKYRFSSFFSFVPYAVESFYSLGTVAITYCIFLTFYELKTKKGGKIKNASVSAVKGVAGVSLETFLISKIYDDLFLRIMFENRGITEFTARSPYLLWLTPLKFVLSVLSALILHFIAGLIIKFIFFVLRKIKARFKKKETASE